MKRLKYHANQWQIADVHNKDENLSFYIVGCINSIRAECIVKASVGFQKSISISEQMYFANDNVLFYNHCACVWE